MDTLKIKVDNVKCGGCVANITNNLNGNFGITDISIEIDTGLVTMSGNNLDNDQIKDKLVALGYPPSSDG